MLEVNTKKRDREDKSRDDVELDVTPQPTDNQIDDPDEVIEIKPIECFNDYIALIQFDNRIAISGIELPDDAKYGNTGIIIGVGPGVASVGGRTPLVCKVGDTVMFHPKSGRDVIDVMSGSDSYYAGKRVVMLIEKSLMCKTLKQRKFKLV